MDKILGMLLSTPWGRSFVGWTSISAWMLVVGIGWAYLSLLDDYKDSERRKAIELESASKKLEKCWDDRNADLKYFHARQDTLDVLPSKFIKKRR